jgi:hypothetical protein
MALLLVSNSAIRSRSSRAHQRCSHTHPSMPRSRSRRIGSSLMNGWGFVCIQRRCLCSSLSCQSFVQQAPLSCGQGRSRHVFDGAPRLDLSVTLPARAGGVNNVMSARPAVPSRVNNILPAVPAHPALRFGRNVPACDGRHCVLDLASHHILVRTSMICDIDRVLYPDGLNPRGLSRFRV